MNYNGEYHEGVHECFISKDLFQLVQKQLELRNRRKIRRHSFAFIGLMKCGECGASITAEQHIKKYKNGNSQSVGVRGIGPPASRSRTVRSADELHPALKSKI